MPVQKEAIRIAFGGLLTRGNPLDRPPNSSVKCQNLRLMPGVPGRGPYPRLRGGRKIQLASSGGSFLRLFQWRKLNAGNYTLAAFVTSGGSGSWRNLDITTTPYTQSTILSINGTSGDNSPLPFTGVRDKLFLGNGFGSRSGSESKPPFSQWDGTTIRYVGLDAYCVGGNPTASFASGAGNNTIISSVDIWVGLHNTFTQHFSNAVFAGRLSTPGTGTISVTNLTRLTYTFNNATEQGELKYVFYASIDGGETAYMVLNSSLNGPYTVAAGTSSANLSITSLVPAGFVLDLTQERPIENYPPREMSQIAYANGRVYGILNFTQGSAGNAPSLPGPTNYYTDFIYNSANTLKSQGAVVWSAAADDISTQDFVGVPEEAFPLRNKKAAPNGEIPIKIDAAPGGSQLLVITTSGTFLLYEAADGLHQWVTISDTDGIGNMLSYVVSRRGPMWVTQRKQLVLLDKESLRLEYLSEDFGAFLGSTGRTYFVADYLYDPQNQVDYYEIHGLAGSTNVSLVYDFYTGMAYEKTAAMQASAARTIINGNNIHHMLAYQSGGIYTQEGDPFTGLVATRDELSSGVFTDINGEYISQWMSFGDPRERKRFVQMDIAGDGELSAALTNQRPLTVSYYVDLDSEEHLLSLEKSPQSQNSADHNYRALFRDGNFNWLKLRIQIAGHGSEQTTYPMAAIDTAEIPPDFYGCIYDMAPLVHPTGNKL